MKTIKLLLVLLIPILLNFVSCEFGLEEEEVTQTYKVSINGQVVDNNSGDALKKAHIKITDGITVVRTTSGSEGFFNTEFEFAEDSELLVITNKEGYHSDTSDYFVMITTENISPLINLIPKDNNVINESGTAASIYLYSQDEKSVGVKESGANETVYFTFQVLDSIGAPIGSGNSVVMRFILNSDLEGGEYLFPPSKETNALGRAGVTLNSGTMAGVVQVIAEVTSNNGKIRSKPILLSIYGGFPDNEHFDVACEDLNYPAWGLIGFEIPFTAYVGDKYTNPVRPGTSVYFHTTSGIIDGSNLTDNLGRSAVTLLTQGAPNHPQYGPGFFVVTASTINENQETIETSTVRLLSGLPVITVSPSTFNLPNGGSQLFNYTVSDGNGNPLSAGTTISINVTEGDIKVEGDTDIKLIDTQSKYYTNFAFTLYDAKPDTLREHRASIQIETTGRNGDKKLSISGIAR